MINLTKFREDLTKTTLEEALINNQLSIKDAFELALHNNDEPAKPRKRDYKYKRVSKYVYIINKHFTIRRRVHGKSMIFGAYYTVEDAEKIVEYLNEYGWEQKRVDEYCELAGVERYKSIYQRVVYS